MKHLGNICQINGGGIAPVDVVIGGFPLIWGEINGKGSCLWASEIEEFPMAVTKYHFNRKDNQ